MLGLRLIALTILAAGIIVNIFLPSPAQAQSIAISGSFYRHHFQLYPGGSLTDPDIYIRVYNPGDDDIKVNLSTVTPPNASITLSDSEFTIAAGENQKIITGVSASKKATPGEYDISIIANVEVEKGTGIVIANAVKLRARLTISGDIAIALIKTNGPDGNPFAATVDLYHKTESGMSLIDHSETGELETVLTPGKYVVKASYKGIDVGEEEFQVEGGDSKSILLAAQTVFIDYFTVEPVNHENTDDIAAAEITYSVNNVFQSLENVKMLLYIYLEKEPLEKIELSSISKLEEGTIFGSYQYAPIQGWQDGSYSFELELVSQDKVLSQSTVNEFAVGEAVGETAASPGGINWKIILAGAGGLVVLLLLLGAALWWRRNTVKVLLENPQLTAIFSKETGEVVKTRIDYSIVNERKSSPEVRVELQVAKDDAPPNNITIANITSLEKGRSDASYEYVPEEGWQDGIKYRFKLALYLADKLDTLARLKMTSATEPG